MAKLVNIQPFINEVVKKRFPIKSTDSVFAAAKMKEMANKHVNAFYKLLLMKNV